MKMPIVNKKDEIIGYKDRAEINYEKDIFRTASAWITNSKGEVLLAQRKFDKKVDPGKWAEAVGGTVEGEDSYEDTVVREADEELGIKNIQVHLGPKQFIETPCDYFVQWYMAVIDLPIEAFTIQETEVEGIAWVEMEQLKEDLRLCPNKYIAAMPEIVALFDNK